MRPAASIVVVFGAIGLILGLSTEPSAAEPAGKDWVGKKVVPKHRDFTLRSSGDDADRKGRPGLYQVKEARGSSILLERSGIRGWVEAEQFLPIEVATKFFDEVIRANSQDPFGYIMRAKALIIDKKDFEHALADLDQAVQLDPKDALAYVSRGVAWSEKEAYDKAVADFDQAIRLDPKDASTYLSRGCAWVAKQEIDRAMADLDQAIRLNPNDATVYGCRGWVWVAKQEYDKAIADFDRAIQLDPKLALAYGGRGHVRRAQQQYDKAIADFDRAIQLDPKLAMAYGGRGHVRRAQQQYDVAIADLTAAIQLAPQDAKPFFERGICWQEKGEITKAVADYNEAVHLDLAYTDAAYDKVAALSPKNDEQKTSDFPPPPLLPGTRDVSAYFKRDDVLSGAGTSISVGPARADLLSIEALGSLPGPDERTFNSQRAARYGDKGMTADSKRDAPASSAYRVLSKTDDDKPIDQHGMAILLNPPCPGASVGSATAWIDEERNKALADPIEAAVTWFNWKEYDKAIAACNEAISIDPKRASAYDLRAIIWKEKKDYEKAIADCNVAIGIDPRCASAYVHRATVWQERKEYEKAIADCNEAIRLDPNQSNYNCSDSTVTAYLIRGRCSKAKKDYGKAIADYNETIRLDSESVVAHYFLAYLLATCSDSKYRDGKKAVESATKACELTRWNEPAILDTLAAAFAELGDFASAVKWQSKAIELLNDDKTKDDYRTRLKVYVRKKPYHETTP